MATTILRKNKPLKERADDFLLRWHRFPIDYWWRKKYNVPFGSSKHREMSLIDMFLEFKEELNMLKEERQEVMVESPEDDNVVSMSQQEIDDEYENLDLSKFDKQ